MSNSSREEIVKVLTDLQASTPNIQAISLTTAEGRSLGSTMPIGMEKVQVGAISAASLAIARKGTRELYLGDVKQVHIMGEKGLILLFNVGMKAVLTMIANETVGFEVILREAKKAVDRLAALV